MFAWEGTNGPTPDATQGRPPVTVRDMIEMTTAPVEDLYVGGILHKENIARFSPDGRHFVVVLRRGILANNATTYWIVLFTEHGTRVNSGSTILSIPSSSTRPAIHNVTWLDDRTITFLADTLRRPTELYTLDIYTRHVTRVTNHSEQLFTYAISRATRSIVFAAMQTPPHANDKSAQGAAAVVDKQRLDALLTGRNLDVAGGLFAKLFVTRLGSTGEHPIAVDGVIDGLFSPSLSPDGKHLIVRTMLTTPPPQEWRRYQNWRVQTALDAKYSDGVPSNIYQLELVDLVSLKRSKLLASPVPAGDYPDIIWSPDSKSVALSGVYLPFSGSIALDSATIATTRFAVEVNVSNGLVTPISRESVHLFRWDASSGKLIGAMGRYETGSLNEGVAVAFKKTKGIWLPASTSGDSSCETCDLKVTLEQSMNVPPKIVVENVNTGEQRVLMDLNPSFERLAFGEVRNIDIVSATGVHVNAGIYLPVGYREGVRYPLIIQTHGWDPDKFWIDGPYSTAFAAQALAGCGFIVVQLGYAKSETDLFTISGVNAAVSGYDALVDYLAARDMVDTNRLGIVGFSITGLSVKYALTHSKYSYRAATLADPEDDGYFKYIANLNSSPGETVLSEEVNGGIPIGTGIRSWLPNGLNFGVEQTSAPVRLEANSPEFLLFCWETLAILRRVHKPVELIYIPDGEHVLIRPKDRWVSQQGNVDWLRFWLQGYEDPDPTKADQYRRWDHLRDLQKAEDGTSEHFKH
jgi:hypothetical protein